MRLKNCKYLFLNVLILKNGGETGIRTLGTLARTTVFETAPFDHSGISPRMTWLPKAGAKSVDAAGH
jgi:hypothetical protein